MSLRVITTTAEFERLQPVWEAVYRSNANHTPFQSWEWNFAWWRNFGEERSLRLLLVEHDGQALGLAPFYLRTRFYGFPLRHLGFIGQKRGDYLDFVVAAGQEAAFFRAVCAYLQQGEEGWQVLELKDMPENSTNLQPLFTELREGFPLFGVEHQRLCVTVPLTPDWESFLQTLGKRTRKDVSYDRRYLDRHYKTEFKIFTNSTAVFDGFRDLTAIYQARWQEEKGAGRLAEESVLKFEEEVCGRISQRGDYRLYLLYADGKPAAGLSGFVSNGKYYGDIYAHAPEFQKFSAGNVLLGMAIEDCIQNGWRELDLSRGDEAYKLRWNGRIKRNCHLKIFRDRFAAARAALFEGLYERASESTTLNQMLARYRRWRYGG
ncbi:MAG: hypothetical protein DKINENOH_01792 [bacterium]|nr:hypothetical protein [bacterium]